jgi:hypothetical protein
MGMYIYFLVLCLLFMQQTPFNQRCAIVRKVEGKYIYYSILFYSSYAEGNERTLFCLSVKCFLKGQCHDLIFLASLLTSITD